MTKFYLGQRSRENLAGVHPDLVKLVFLAIDLTDVDFMVGVGVRSDEDQLQAWQDSRSQLNGIPKGEERDGIEGTGLSRHQSVNGGPGHAVDLWAYVRGEVMWDWSLYFRIAAAMQEASREVGIPIIWGGAWGQLMHDFEDPEQACANYVAQRRSQNRPAFIDGPHFELSSQFYPA